MNKRLLFIFSGLILLVLVIVLNSTVFLVKHVLVQSDSGDDWYNVGDIIESSGITIGKNIFTVSETRIKLSIEEEHYSVKVMSIERTFPDGVIIKISRRVPMLRIAIDNNYLICDSELYVMDIVAIDSGDYIGLTKIIGLNESGEYNRGTRLDSIDYLIDITAAAFSLELIDIAFSTFFKQIDLSYNYQARILTNTGVTLVLTTGTDLSLSAQLTAAYSIYVGLDVNNNKRYGGYYYLTQNGWKWSENLS